MAESVKVVVRCRPLNKREKSEGHAAIVTVDESERTIVVNTGDKTKKQFTFDAVYGIDSQQSSVYTQTAYPIVEAVLSGYNGTIFAYGQTGAGKSHTMFGDISSKEGFGILPNSIHHIFDYISKYGGAETKYLVRANFVELYNEEVRDLLSTDQKKLEIKEDSNGVYLKDVASFVVESSEEMLKLIDQGNSRRAVAATAMNEKSSRSHSLFTITVETASQVEGTDESLIKVGKLHLVDLAGSERQSKTLASGDRLKEAAKINLSLTCLGNVIAALVDGKISHIPYRDSKLTRLLQDSLGGNAKTCMLAAISPASFNSDETLSTLRYAHRTKQIKNKPKVNEDPKDAMLREYQDEIKRIKELLKHEAEAAGQSSDVHEMTDEQLAKMQDQVLQEKEAAEATENPEEQEKLLEELKKRSEDLEQERIQREVLNLRLEQMQSKLLAGGENLLSKAEEQEKKLAEQENFIAEQLRIEEKLKQDLEEQEDQYFQIQQNFSSLKDEAADKTAKLKKLWNVTMRVKSEITDAQDEISREREELLETIRSLVVDLKLKAKIVESYIPSVYLSWIEANSRFDDIEGIWKIPQEEFAGNRVANKKTDYGKVGVRISEEKDAKVRELNDPENLYLSTLISYNDMTDSSVKPFTGLKFKMPPHNDDAPVEPAPPPQPVVTQTIKPQQKVDLIPEARGFAKKKAHYA